MVLWMYLIRSPSPTVMGVPIAAGILYPLWDIILASAAMAFSSVSVVINSLLWLPKH